MVNSMKVASIDIGTNSIRLLLASFEENKFSEVHKKLQMTRLGKGVNETQLLDDERMSESVEVIVSFCKEAEKYGAQSIVMMATSAVRDALNSSVFTQAVFEKTGRQIDIISGDLEAEIGFLGVLLGSSNPDQTILVIDIGGGSTELIVGNKKGIQFAQSLNIGAVRLTGTFVKHDPVQREDIMGVLDEIQKNIDLLKEDINLFNIDAVVGIGGTATTYATMVHKVATYNREQVHGLEVTSEQLSNMNQTLAQMSVNERKQVIGLEPKRADIIYVGGLILQSILEKIGKDSFIVSDYDNLEGYIAYKSAK